LLRQPFSLPRTRTEQGRQAREEAAFIGVQTILGGLVALVILGAVTALAIVGLALGAYFVSARRYILALIALVPSLLVGSFAASGWLQLLRSPPERDVVIDFRKDVPSNWMAATFSNCKPSPVSPSTICDSNGHINKVQLTLPDGVELQTVAKYITVSVGPDANRLISANLVLHPYMTALDAIASHSKLTTVLFKEAKNPVATAKQGKDVEVWLGKWRDSTGAEIPKKTDNYVCVDRDRYRFCTRYGHSSFGQGFTVTYEISASDVAAGHR
jgi:hypothetical protein